MTDAAKVYGQALYELARDEGLSQTLLAQLDTLRKAFSAEPGFLQLLGAPSVPKCERCQVIDDSFKGRFHPYVVNFLKILTEKGYVKHFDRCCQVFRQQCNTDNGILCVTAVTAVPLSDGLRGKLLEKLSSTTGKAIDLTCKVDPDCLGGIRLSWDGKELDGTVRRRLDDIRSIIKICVL